MTYFNIFLESAWKASIIPLGNDTTFFAMKAFGNYNMTTPFLLSITGAMLGQLFNWLVGRFLVGHKARMKVSDYWQNRVSTLFNKYGIFLLLFSWVPLCNLIVVLAGFVGTRIKIVLPLVMAGQIFYYGCYLI